MGKEASIGSRSVGEIVQFKIVEEEKVVEVPKYVEVLVEKPVFVEKEYMVPVYKEVVYEKPVVNMKDITDTLKPFIMQEVEKALAAVVQNLKFSFELPFARVIQVKPGKGEQ